MSSSESVCHLLPQISHTMHTHPNARLTPVGRQRLVRRHIEKSDSLAELAAQAGISLRTASKWLARYRSGAVTALVDRRSVRRTQRRMVDPKRLQHDVELRHQRLYMRYVQHNFARALEHLQNPSAWRCEYCRKSLL